MVTAIDLGSWTLDLMPVVNRDPDESRCVTLPHGVITCIQQINRECVRQLNGEADEAQIQQFLINGGGASYEAVWRDFTKQYTFCGRCKGKCKRF